MKHLLLVIAFYLCSITLCAGQADSINMHDCHVLETVFKDTMVKRVLLSRKCSGFTITNAFFQECKSFNFNGKKYQVFDSVTASKMAVQPLDIVIHKGDSFYNNKGNVVWNHDKCSFKFDLEDYVNDMGFTFEVVKKKGKYKTRLISLHYND